MKIYNSIEEFSPIEGAVVSIGTFDGVHRGHQALLKRIRSLAREKNGQSVLLTFDPHPRIALYGDQCVSLITSREEKIRLISHFDIDHLIVHPFTREFASMDPSVFIRDCLVKKIGCRYLVIGYDHRFGHGREGSFQYLKEYQDRLGFSVEEIPARQVDEIAVSSTKIRHALLEEGDIPLANNYLGHPFTLSGKVVEGRQNGRKIGFPTANIALEDPYKLIPKNGVYAVKVHVGKRIFSGMMNIGIRPTLNGKDRTIEVNLFGFDGNLYGKTVTVVPVKRLRPEIRFESLEQLKEQLVEDRRQALSILGAESSAQQ